MKTFLIHQKIIFTFEEIQIYIITAENKYEAIQFYKNSDFNDNLEEDEIYIEEINTHNKCIRYIDGNEKDSMNGFKNYIEEL